jgi:hypothetical protein
MVEWLMSGRRKKERLADDMHHNKLVNPIVKKAIFFRKLFIADKFLFCFIVFSCLISGYFVLFNIMLTLRNHGT